MFRIILMLLLVFSNTATAGVWDNFKNVFSTPAKPKPPTIKVLILNDASSALVEVRGRYFISDPYQNKKLGVRYVGKRNTIQPQPTGLKWGEEFPGVYQLKIEPASHNATVIVNGVEYKGPIYIYDIGGTISIVNEVNIEDYLIATLSSKINKEYHKEAMNALAITARTEAYYIASYSTNSFWHVDAQKVNYYGNFSSEPNASIVDAVNATKYMVMSLTGAYEGYLTPFIAKWTEKESKEKGVLSLEFADKAANQGNHAAKILSQTFPKMSIEMTHYSTHSHH